MATPSERERRVASGLAFVLGATFGLALAVASGAFLWIVVVRPGKDAAVPEPGWGFAGFITILFAAFVLAVVYLLVVLLLGLGSRRGGLGRPITMAAVNCVPAFAVVAFLGRAPWGMTVFAFYALAALAVANLVWLIVLRGRSG